MDQWLEEYEELVQDVLGSNHQTFSLNVQRWIDFLDSHDLVGPYLKSWESVVDFNSWWTATESSGGRSIGQGILDWPRETKERLALQLGLFRAFGDGRLEVPSFALQFFYVRNGNFDVQTENLGKRLFLPFAKELRRTISKLDLNPPATDEGFIPASDRVVSLDHNSSALKDTIESTDELIATIRKSNSFENPSDKDQRLAEMSATKELLRAPKMRHGVFRSLILPCLKWLEQKFADGSIGMLAAALIAALVAILEM